MLWGVNASTTTTPPLPSPASVVPRVRHLGRPRRPDPGSRPPLDPSGTPSAPGALSPLGLLTLLLGAALPMIDFFIVNVALPTIDKDLDAGPAMLEMVAAGYGVAYAVLLVLGGRLGDTVGRRRLFLIGTALFALTSLACGLAPDAWTLVVARVVQGAASALMLPQVLATIQSTTTGQRRGRALGLYGATGGIAAVLGQVAGGWLVAADIAGSGWRSIFLVNVPVAAAAIVLSLRTVPETRSPRPARVDVRGTALLAATLLTLLVPLMEGHAVGWPWWTWLLLALSPVFGAAFWRVERSAERSGGDPLLPPSLLANDGMRGGLLVALPYFTGFGGFMFVMAVALQQGMGLGPVIAGTALAPMAAAYFAASLLAPRLVNRFGRHVVTGGLVTQGLGLVAVIGTAFAAWPRLGALDLVPAMLVLGFGQGLVMGPLFRVVLSEVPADRAGVGGGVLTTTQQSSLALGVATLGTLFLSLSAAHGTLDALAVTLLVQLAVVVTAIALSVRLPRQVA
ncbi:MFS transporter [Streptantibioticus silvisoli]|uniref:MFS transporter n=1 Tax=Streptantibioticus silvisoli TaxID=2705255 RepID=A0ABT6VSJ6_9ACTN|nr:MFS transporter [Streptantibioticus silvisoli]MDI5961455.1 MFS transporter [Streptantibioticus silvisoli]